MPPLTIRRYIVGLALLIESGVGAAAEPQVDFSLKAGWVECGVTKDGEPVRDAVFHIISASGSKFAEGETDDRGQGQFPVPPGKWFIVEIKTGTRTADAIRLVHDSDGIQPAKVLLSYGLRPCCRVLAKKDATPKPAAVATGEARSIWLLAGTAFSALAFATIIILATGRRSPVQSP